MRDGEQAANCAPLSYGLVCTRLVTIYYTYLWRLVTIYYTYLWRRGVFELTFPP
jgi:hypothetical protein